MPPKTWISCLLLSAALSSTALGQIPVRYVLARQVVMADRAPSSSMPSPSDMVRSFQAKFEAAFPSVISLDSPDKMISPEERVIVIIPKITVARLTDEFKAGSVHSFSALVVGDISAIDPWTNANLYSGTRMISSNFEIGTSALSHLDSTSKDAFQMAVDKWLNATIEQMRLNFAPFVLNSSTVALPEKVKQFKGGIWPFGSERGVKTGQTIMGGTGQYAKVSAVFQNYSIITDVSNQNRTIPAGEVYSLTLVDKPTDRPEPRISLSWLGKEPSAPDGDSVQVLSSAAMVSLFDNYLSKGGGFKVLPPDIDNPTAAEQLKSLSQEISSHSKMAILNYGSFERENYVQRASVNPDSRIRIGVLERYHGTRSNTDGSVQNYYRVTLAASVENFRGSDEAPLYAAASIVTNVEELAKVGAPGIREIDPVGTYLTLYRNAVINLAKKVRENAIGSHDRGEVRTALVGNEGIDWKGAQPGAFTPMSWFRPIGELISNSQPLGTLYRPMQPSQGYLNATTASLEKLSRGDILRYQSTSIMSQPIVGINLKVQESPPDWLPEQAWLQRLAGASIGAAANVQIIPISQGEEPPLGVEKLLLVKVAALGATTQLRSTTFTGQWRCQIRALQSDPSSAPILQFGIQSDLPATLKATDLPLQPLDVGNWGLDYTTNALKSLAQAGSTRNLKQAFSAAN